MGIPITMRRTICILACAVSLAAFAQNDHDATILDYVGHRFPCSDDLAPTLRIQNMGNVTMVTCVVETWKNGVIDNSFNWVLAVPAATGATRQPTLPLVSGVQTGDVVEFRIIDVNGVPDEDTTGNIVSVPMDVVPVSASAQVALVEVLTDASPSETTWALRDDAGTVLGSGGPYSMASALDSVWVTMDPARCYQLRVDDAGGNGMAGGHVRLYDQGGLVADVDGTAFGDHAYRGVLPGIVMGVDPGQAGDGILRLFPVPADLELQMQLPADAQAVRVIDALGREMALLQGASLPMRAVLSVDRWPAGTYVVQVLTVDGEQLVRSVQVRH